VVKSLWEKEEIILSNINFGAEAKKKRGRDGNRGKKKRKTRSIRRENGLLLKTSKGRRR